MTNSCSPFTSTVSQMMSSHLPQRYSGSEGRIWDELMQWRRSVRSYQEAQNKWLTTNNELLRLLRILLINLMNPAWMMYSEEKGHESLQILCAIFGFSRSTFSRYAPSVKFTIGVVQWELTKEKIFRVGIFMVGLLKLFSYKFKVGTNYSNPQSFLGEF